MEKSATLTDNPMVISTLGGFYGYAGRKEDALKILGKLQEAAKKGYIPPIFLADVYYSLGDKDRAFQLLDQAYEERSSWLSWMRAPAFDPLRADPRFKAIEKKVGLYDVQ